MLLVIFGAGASYDSVLNLPLPPPPMGAQSNFGCPFQPVRDTYEDSRPPLANQLFDNRRGLFASVMNFYIACKPLVNLLRTDVLVERQLAMFEKQAENYPARRSQLAAIQYYLHHMLWICQDSWHNHHQGVTNYLTFLGEIDRWCHQHNEQVCYVTFNYDTMLEESMKDLWAWTFDHLSAYISHPRFKLIKLHGSIDWGHELKDSSPKTAQEVIRDAAVTGINKSEEYRKAIGITVQFADGSHGFPALAIPVEKKSEFVCPPEHLSALADVLPKVTKIITIGWRATEQNFLTMLKKRLTGLRDDVDLMVVSGDIHGVTETNKNLGLAKVRSYATVATGFSGLIRDMSRLEKFLE